MVAYIIIPGIDGSDEQHWQTLWERELGPGAVRIAPASWSEPELADWVGSVQAAYEAAHRTADESAYESADETARGQGEPGGVVLVAHSLGCWAAAAWLADAPAGRVRGALLVAPPDPEGPAFPRRAAATFLGLRARPLSCPALVVGSPDDPYCTPETTAHLAEQWQARLHVTDAGGHLNSASGLGTWPQGRGLLHSLTADCH
ncbi:RBBP9/YdeN family alpha/beta hydrolase [Streptomyces mesophilus]|uniref:RBBP9/YdeN family alpha/beta hydrolase n=1 Tax=Streptomyces mesophilus TaxID=1775132 RepID=UPI00331E67F7